MPVLTLIGLWIGSRHIGRLEATQGRARAGGGRTYLSGAKDAAGDPRAAIAARIGALIVGGGVDDDRRAVRVEQGIGARRGPRRNRERRSRCGRRRRRRPRGWAGRPDAAPADSAGRAAARSGSSAGRRWRSRAHRNGPICVEMHAIGAGREAAHGQRDSYGTALAAPATGTRPPPAPGDCARLVRGPIRQAAPMSTAAGSPIVASGDRRDDEAGSF